MMDFTLSLQSSRNIVMISRLAVSKKDSSRSVMGIESD